MLISRDMQSSVDLSRLNSYKFLPPAPKGALPRRNLITRLVENEHDARLIVLCADAGYGKTTLLREFMEASDTPIIWYRLDKTDREPCRFIHNLLDGIRNYRNLPGYFPDSAVELNQPSFLQSSDLDHLVLFLIDELKELAPVPVTLLLDNFEIVNSSSEINSVIRSLLELMPEQHRLIISSRKRPNLPLSLLRSRQELMEIGSADLVLNKDEIRTLLLQFHNLALEDDELNLIAAKTEGWAAGVVMVAQSLRFSSITNGSTKRFLNRLSGQSRIVFDYLSDEVFAHRDTATQSFLIQTSILSHLTAGVCRDITGITNTQEILKSLEEDNLFTFAVESRRDCFRYHPLFREFLLFQAHCQLTESDIRALHRKAAIALEARGDFDEAHQHFIHAGESEAAADLVERVGDYYLNSGQQVIVLNWLNSMPEGATWSRPWLLALRGKALRCVNHASSAMNQLERAYRLFEQTNDKSGLAWVTYELSDLHNQQTQIAAGIRRAEHILASVDEGTLDHTKVLFALSSYHFRLGELTQAKELGERALVSCQDLTGGPETALIRSRGHRSLALIYAKQGQPSCALHAIEQALDLVHSGRVCALEQSWVHLTHGWILSLFGELNMALSTLQQAECHQCEHDSEVRRLINLVRGNIYQDLGDYARATASYQQAGNQCLTNYAFLLLCQGEVTKAHAMAHKALRFAERRVDEIEKAVAMATLGIVLAADCKLDTARTCLAQSVRVFEKLGTHQRKASLCLHLAHLEFSAGNSPAGLDHLREALQTAAQHDLRHFNWWNPSMFASLAANAIIHDIETSQVASIVGQKIQGEHFIQLADLLSFENADVQSFIGSILVDIRDETTNTFGETEQIAKSVLEECADETVRRRLLGSVRSGLVAIDSLSRMRIHHGLTWRELDVYCEYYLRGGLSRREHAWQLCMSENTLKAHVSSIRRKLNLDNTNRA